MFGGNFAPRFFAFCDGQLLNISQNINLFSILSTTYGGDGRFTFALPDLRGRVPVHAGTGNGLTTRQLGERAGSETSTLTMNTLPSHNHPMRVVSSDGNTILPANAYLAQSAEQDASYSTENPDATLNSAAIESAGSGSQAVNNIQPVQVVNFIIALQGILPS
jgi:microcystin-dependent protein